MKIHNNNSVDFHIDNPFFQKKDFIDIMVKILDESFIVFGKNIKYDWILNFRKPLTKSEYTKVIFPYISTYLNNLGYKNFAVKGFGGFPFIGLNQYSMESFLYLRDQEKNYGIRKQIEGCVPKTNQLVLIDDITNFGVSAKKTKYILEKNCYDVGLVFSLAQFTWNNNAHNFHNAKYETIVKMFYR